jgi:hypothetical protein
MRGLEKFQTGKDILFQLPYYLWIGIFRFQHLPPSGKGNGVLLPALTLSFCFSSLDWYQNHLSNSKNFYCVFNQDENLNKNKDNHLKILKYEKDIR